MSKEYSRLCLLTWAELEGLREDIYLIGLRVLEKTLNGCVRGAAILVPPVRQNLIDAERIGQLVQGASPKKPQSVPRASTTCSGHFPLPPASNSWFKLKRM